MKLSDYDLKQMDDAWVEGLPADRLRLALRQTLNELKEARDRLNMTPENSSRPPGSMAPWERFVPMPESPDDGVEPAAEQCKKAELRDKDDLPDSGAGPAATSPKRGSGKPPGKPPGAQGFGRTQQLPVDDTCLHVPAQCAACAMALPQTAAMQAWTAWDQVDIVPLTHGQSGLKLYCTKHILFEIECSCGHVTRALACRAPVDERWRHTGVCEWRLSGPFLAAMIVVLAMRMRLSRARIREFFAEFVGLSLSTGLIDNTMREAGRACEPLEEELVLDIQQAAMLNIDETSWKEKAELLWLWTVVSASTVYFTIGHRSSELLVNLLEDKFSGIIMSDGYRVYREWTNRLRCWAHLIRKATGLAESVDARVAKIGHQIEAHFDVLMSAIYAARLEPPRDALIVLHDKTIVNLKQLCEQHSDDSHKKLRELARELLLDWHVIMRQVREPYLALMNNAAEQSLRDWVISRLISHGTRSAEGTRAFVLLASVIETCRLRSASPWRYLATVIDAARKAGAPPLLPKIHAFAAGV